MTRTTILKMKDKDGQEQGFVFGDLLELYTEIDMEIGNAEKVTDLATSLLLFKKRLGDLIQDTINQAEEQNKKTTEPKVEVE